MRWILLPLLTTAVGCAAGEIDDNDDGDRTSTIAPPPPSLPPDAPSTASTAPSGPATAEAPPAQPAPADPSPPAIASKKAEVTYYYVAERPEGDPDHVAIKDCDGALLTMASKTFHAAVEMERTARATSPTGKRITFNDVGGCFRVLDAKYPWGIGVTSKTEGAYPLIPFRSIAVDPAVFTLGKWYFVRELVGKKTPSPSVFTHDGCVRAVDVGSAIKGAHIDFFTGNAAARASFTMENVTVEDAAGRCPAS